MKWLKLLIPAAVLGAVVLAVGAVETATFDQGSGSKAPAPAKPVNLTIEANGDLLIHSPIFNLALADGGGSNYDFNPMLKLVKPIVSAADLAVCHVETPMTSAQPTGYPLFNTPPSLSSAIAATGWDACDTASNHSLDQGQTGVDQTAAALDRAGVAHTGSWATAAGHTHPLILSVKGVRIAWLAYTEMTNGIPLPNPWTVAIASAPRILADARAARGSGAQAVIVNIHWGDEYQSQPSSFQMDLAQKLTASPAITAVVGQHVHVVQPIQWINGKPVVFGEGNLLSNQTPNCCPAASQDGLMAMLHLRASGSSSRVIRVDYVPVWVRHPDFTVIPVQEGLKRGLAPRDELTSSWQRTTSVVGSGPHTRPL